MGMMVIFSVVVLCLGMVTQQAVCERYHIVASPSDPCPGERNGEFCFTLQQFISEFYSLSVGQHLTLELEPGIHTLASRSLYITRKNLLEIIGHNATINCSRYISRSFNLQSIEQVSISGINFIDCHRIYLNTVYNATISGSKFDTHLRPLSTTGLELRTTNVAIHSCTFVGLSTGVYLYSSNSSINFCTFVGQSTGLNLYYSSSSSINSCNFVGNRRGMSIQYSTATIFNCTLRDNRISVSYGSAIYIYSSSLVITQSSFINNTALSGGGAIYIGVNYFTTIESSVTIDGCIFANNMAYQGGAIYIDISWQIYISQPLNCTIYRSVFINNNAIVRGGAINAADNVSIVDSIFGYNTAPQCAVFSLNGISTSSSLFESTIFLYNQATNSTAEEDDNMQYLGGVACVRDTSFVASNCTFSHNTAKHSGGVLHAEDSSVAISSSSFHNNSAGIDGGVLYTYLLPSTYYVLQRCSFTNNRAGDDGGAIYIGKTRSTLDIGMSLFSYNVANDRGGAIIVFGSTIGMEQTDMHGNEAASGDDIGMCTASNITGPSTYFTYFQQRTYSTPTTECLFYSRLTRIFHNPTPEDHSNVNLAQYLVLSNVSSDHNNLPMATTGTTDVYTTNPERELLMDLRNKITETSSVQYVIFAISLLFVIVLAIAIVMKFKTVCLKKKARGTECYDLDKRNTGIKYNDHNESPEILYAEPEWKDDRSDAIKVRPNAGYAKH